MGAREVVPLSSLHEHRNKTPEMINPSDIWNHLPLTNAKFNDFALEVYQFQSVHNNVYAQWCDLLGKSDENVNKVENIPFLPISIFKTHKVSAFDTHELMFTSSGTSGSERSQHYIYKERDYIDSFTFGFHHYFKGQKFDYLAALLPSYLDRTGSGLIHMVQHLMQNEIGDGKFYNRDFKSLVSDLEYLTQNGKRILLFGVTFGLLELSKISNNIDWNCVEIVETGGMKGHGKEQIRGELYSILKKAFPGIQIHSEYGMTELCSQAYANESGWFKCPSWMRVMIQDPSDPYTFLETGKTGRICIIDLMNYHSCPFIATDDLGKMNAQGEFEVLGRLDYADIRGCNQLL